MTAGSTLPFEGQPECGVDLACENGHQQRLFLSGMTRQMAEDYAQMLDGSSPMYVRDPRSDPTNTWIGRCKDCGGVFTATVFGFD